MAVVLQEVKAERKYQDEKWGTAFDDKNTLNDWAAYIGIYLGKATDMGNSAFPDIQRKYMLKVATLAVAAVETFDRNEGFPPRHYDPKEKT